MFLKNQKDYGLLKSKNRLIRKLKADKKALSSNMHMISVFEDITDLPLALVNEVDEIIWMNKGFNQVFKEGFSKGNNWETIRQRMVIATSSRTGVKNSVKIRGKGAEDFILRSHVFSSGSEKLRLLKLSEATAQAISSDLVSSTSSFNPIELVEFIVEKLGSWSNIYDFKIQESGKFAAFYEMDESILKTEMGALVASIIYFIKSHRMKPRFIFEIETANDGFSFKVKLEKIHLKSEEIGSSVELNGKRYTPLMDSFSKIEDNLRFYDGRVLVKNFTSSKNGKYSEVLLMVKERTLFRENFEIAQKEQGERL